MLCNHIRQLPEPGCWFSSTTGDTGVKVTLLSVLVEAVLRLPAASLATPTAMLAITVPSVLMPLTDRKSVVEGKIAVRCLVPPAVPQSVTPARLKRLPGLLSTA